MKDPYGGKLISADQAIAPIRSGQHILIGSGAAEPELLVEALSSKGKELADIEVIHLLTLGTAPYTKAEFQGHFRHNALFIGPNVRPSVEKGLADYTPCFLSEVPSLIRSGRLPIDVALIQTTLPENGFCSLGVAVDIVKAVVETARYVVAQANPNMPWTEGDSRVLVEDIDAFVLGERPLLELQQPEFTGESLWIGRYVAQLIEDGSTLQLGIGAIPNAILAALSDKKDLGIHSEMISDGVLELIRKGVINGRAKTLHREKIVTSFCMGTKELYKEVNRNPIFEFHPSDYVNSPSIIAKNGRMIAVNSALQVDLTGQVAADSIGRRFYSGIGGQVDFVRGASVSRGGKAIIALPSTAKNGSVSRIVSTLTEGTGVVTTRADVDFIVTEYGIASLKAKTIRERAVALIQIAHPDYRNSLIDEAKRCGYIDTAHILPPSTGGRYLVELETKKRFKRTEVFFRPIKPSDERRLKELFYCQSPETTYLRYGIPLKRLSETQFQKMVAIDFANSMAVAGFVREGRREIMVAVGRYYANPGNTIAEAAFTVLDKYQGEGIGTFLLNYLVWIAKGRGITGFSAEVTAVNPVMTAVMKKCFVKVAEKNLGEDGAEIRALFADWKGMEHPNAEKQAVLLQKK